MTDARAEITALEARRARAITNADISTLAAITGDDYVHVDAGGQLRDKAGFLEVISGGSARYVDYTVADTAITIEGDVAIVTGRFENRAIVHGAARTRIGRHTRVYVRRAGAWVNIVHQGTQIES